MQRRSNDVGVAPGDTGGVSTLLQYPLGARVPVIQM